MPEHRDPEADRLQARLWQEKAAASCGETRDVCLVIADGYVQLAQLIEQRTSVNTCSGFNPDTDHGQQSTVS
jgi:hypothetical protein